MKSASISKIIPPEGSRSATCSPAAAANIADGIAPIVTDEAGNILPIQPLSALGSDDGTNYLNPAAGLQAVGLASAALRGKDATLIGFEDQLSTNPEHDGDFNDALVAVSAAPLSAATLALLAREADGVRLGTAGGDRNHRHPPR